jgi:hypothetical protein
VQIPLTWGFSTCWCKNTQQQQKQANKQKVPQLLKLEVTWRFTPESKKKRKEEEEKKAKVRKG